MKVMMAALLAVLVATPSLAEDTWQPAHGETLYWQIADHKDRVIGHTIQRFSRADGALTMTRSQRIRMRKFMMNIKLDQDVTSVWDKEGLRSLQSSTIADAPVMSRDLSLTVTRLDDGKLKIVSSEVGEKIVDQPAWPMTFWHGSFLRREQFFDAGLGLIKPVTKTGLGAKDLDVAGQTLSCDGMRVETTNHEDKPVTIELWFTQGGEPCQMDFEGPMGASSARRVTQAALVTDH